MATASLASNLSFGQVNLRGIGGEKLWLCPTLGGDKLDISGNGNHGTYNGGMGTVADTSNGGTRAYSFDGVDDYVDFGDILDTSVWTTSKWSVSAWVYVQNNSSYALAKSNTNNARQFILQVRNYSTNINVEAILYGTTGVSIYKGFLGSTALSNNSWYHVVYDYDAARSNTDLIRVYLNGSSETLTQHLSSGTFSSIPNGNASLTIGAQVLATSVEFPKQGGLDDIRVFDRALTTSEITHLASKRGVLGSPKWPFATKRRIFVPATPAPAATTRTISVKKPKPSFATGYARNASESANPNLWKGLVGAWMPSFGVTGNTLKDVSGNGNDGTLTNMDAASDWVATSKGLALDFDGSDDYVSIDAENLYPNLTQATWNFWIKFRSLAYSYNQIAETKPAPSTNNYQLSCLVKSNRKLAFYAYGGAQSNYDGTGIHTLATNRWYNLTYVFKGSERQEGWVDGVYDGGAGSPVASLQASNSDCRFSFSNFATRYINGTYGSVRLYNRALSPAEIKQLYLNPSAPFERKAQNLAVPAAPSFNPYWGNQATQLAGTLQ